MASSGSGLSSLDSGLNKKLIASPMPDRFYAPQSLDGPSVEISGTEAHHLRHVLRLDVGNKVILFDGRGTEATAEIAKLSRNDVQLRVLETRHTPEDSASQFSLAAAVPKGDRFRWLIEKATELGVSRFIPLETERSIVHPGTGKFKRMEQTVIAACKQSGRSRLMAVDNIKSWQPFVDQEFAHRTVLVAHPTGNPLSKNVLTTSGDAETLLVVGPEGGFTGQEIQIALDSGANLVRLGPHILRIETAAIALAAYAQLNRL